MMSFALNHMTLRKQDGTSLLDCAQALGCVGVELRTDVDHPLFDGGSPEAAKEKAARAGLRILALAEVYAFNDANDEKVAEVAHLADLAARSGAEGVVLIPRKCEAAMPRALQQTLLERAISTLRPVLEGAGVKGIIEPLGFETSSLRFKADVVDAINSADAANSFAMIHDTFHHHLAGETEFAPELTSIVHVSGVSRQTASPLDLGDADRGLVDVADQLDNLKQLGALTRLGYAGPVSTEAFAPDIHDLTDPVPALAGSFSFIQSALAQEAA